MSRAHPRFIRPSPLPPAVNPLGQNVYEMTVFGSLFGQTTMNIFHYMDRNTALANPNTADLFAAFNAALSCVPVWLPLVAPAFTITRFKIRLLTVLTQAPDYFVAVAGSVGSNASQADSSIDAVTMEKYTALIGAHGRGRQAFGAIPIASKAAGVLAPAAFAAWTNFAQVLASTLVTATHIFDPVVISGRYKSTTPPATPILGMKTTSWTADLILGSVRRRKIGRGI